MNFARVLAAPLLLILAGTSFTIYPAHAQVSIKPLRQCWTVFPLNIFEGKPWFEAPSCPSGWVPHCARQSGMCITQLNEIAYACREWRCVLGIIPDVKRDESRCEPPTCRPFPCEPFRCPPLPFR
jgi:hypothetical protein